MVFTKFSTPLFTPFHDDNIFLNLLVLVGCNVNAIKPIFHLIEFQFFGEISKIKGFTNPQFYFFQHRIIGSIPPPPKKNLQIEGSF
jgi:hypothetical protein